MFIADNSIFESIMQCFLARSIVLKECYLMKNFEKNSLYRFQNIRNLIKCEFLEGRLPNIFFRKYVPLVVNKL